MSTAMAGTDLRTDKADLLPDDVRSALRDLILVLADSKRVLGLRYSNRMLGAPSLEAGIAASSMAQDEWGHARLTYALLSDFGDEPKALEHERSVEEYRSMAALDRPLSSWSEMIAAALLVDTALTVQYSALVESRYTPVHNRVQKLLDEEGFHFQYAAGWTRRIGQLEAVRDEFTTALRRFLPEMLRWLGRDEAESTRRLAAEGIVRQTPHELRSRFLRRVAPVLADVGLTDSVGMRETDGQWTYTEPLDWAGWADARRRVKGGTLDEETAARARGDKNRAMLLD